MIFTALLATDAGIWVTENIDSTNTQWLPSLNGMPVVRTDMLQYRESDHMILAITYGRGLWTTDALVPPRADMDFQKVSYTNAPTDFRDVSFNAQNWLWSFGDGGTSNDEDPGHPYTSTGNFNVSLSIADGQDIDEEQITILPDRNTPYDNGTSGYAGDFETAGDFAPDNISGTPFQRGSSTQNSKKGTHSGTNAWVTGLNDPFYEHNSHTVLYTPNYDLSEPGIYEFAFWATYAIQVGFDGFRVEYSTDKGKSWSVLGNLGPRWYNYTNTEAQNAVFPPGSEYFTGFTTPNTFVEYKTSLNHLQGQPDVAFRFVFKSDASTRYAGLVIDDVEVRAFRGELKTKIIDFRGEFTSFEEVALTFVTQPEYRSLRFEVEMSTNARDWEKLDTKTAAGFSIDPIGYTSALSNIKLPVHYFRIKAIDQDEAYFYSEVLVLKRADALPDIYSIYPNPFTDVVNIAFNQLLESPVKTELFDVSGRLLYSNTEIIQDAFLQLNFSALPSGTYVLRVIVGDETISRKLIKK